MLLAKTCLGAGARLVYLIEGSLNSKVVHGGSVGRAGLASAEQVRVGVCARVRVRQPL
jgi:hypothetical protein